MVEVKRRKIRLTDVPARQALLDESPHSSAATCPHSSRVATSKSRVLPSASIT